MNYSPEEPMNISSSISNLGVNFANQMQSGVEAGLRASAQQAQRARDAEASKIHEQQMQMNAVNLAQTKEDYAAGKVVQAQAIQTTYANLFALNNQAETAEEDPIALSYVLDQGRSMFGNKLEALYDPASSIQNGIMSEMFRQHPDAKNYYNKIMEMGNKVVAVGGGVNIPLSDLPSYMSTSEGAAWANTQVKTPIAVKQMMAAANPGSMYVDSRGTVYGREVATTWSAIDAQVKIGKLSPAAYTDLENSLAAGAAYAKANPQLFKEYGVNESNPLMADAFRLSLQDEISNPNVSGTSDKISAETRSRVTSRAASYYKIATEHGSGIAQLAADMTSENSDPWAVEQTGNTIASMSQVLGGSTSTILKSKRGEDLVANWASIEQNFKGVDEKGNLLPNPALAREFALLASDENYKDMPSAALVPIAQTTAAGKAAKAQLTAVAFNHRNSTGADITEQLAAIGEIDPSNMTMLKVAADLPVAKQTKENLHAGYKKEVFKTTFFDAGRTIANDNPNLAYGIRNATSAYIGSPTKQVVSTISKPLTVVDTPTGPAWSDAAPPKEDQEAQEAQERALSLAGGTPDKGANSRAFVETRTTTEVPGGIEKAKLLEALKGFDFTPVLYSTKDMDVEQKTAYIEGYAQQLVTKFEYNPAVSSIVKEYLLAESGTFADIQASNAALAKLDPNAEIKVYNRDSGKFEERKVSVETNRILAGKAPETLGEVQAAMAPILAGIYSSKQISDISAKVDKVNSELVFDAVPALANLTEKARTQSSSVNIAKDYKAMTEVLTKDNSMYSWNPNRTYSVEQAEFMRGRTVNGATKSSDLLVGASVLSNIATEIDLLEQQSDQAVPDPDRTQTGYRAELVAAGRHVIQVAGQLDPEDAVQLLYNLRYNTVDTLKYVGGCSDKALAASTQAVLALRRVASNPRLVGGPSGGEQMTSPLRGDQEKYSTKLIFFNYGGKSNEYSESALYSRIEPLMKNPNKVNVQQPDTRSTPKK